VCVHLQHICAEHVVCWSMYMYVHMLGWMSAVHPAWCATSGFWVANSEWQPDFTDMGCKTSDVECKLLVRNERLSIYFCYGSNTVGDLTHTPLKSSCL